MVGVNLEAGSSALRLWIVAGVAAAVGATAWMLLGQQQQQTSRDHDADRRALEIRAQELTAHALAPGSPLACLDAVAGESVDAACEKALFASPAMVAAASAYAAARLELLSDMVTYVKHGGTDIDGMLRPLRRALETDSFGFLAHALAVRDGCTSENCAALDVLGDAGRVRANLSGQTLDRYLDRYATAWAQTPDVPVPVADAAGAASQPATAAQPGAPGQRKVVVNIDFPTAASIPPVSIMNPEPGTKPSPPAATAASATAAPAAASPSKRTRKQANSNPPAQAAAPNPPAETLSSAGQADPVWRPAPLAPPAAPAQAAAPANAPAANFVASGAAPLQLARPPQ